MIIESTIVAALSVTSLASLCVIHQQRNKAKADEHKINHLQKQLVTSEETAARRLKDLDYVVAQFDRRHQQTSLQITTLRLDVLGEGEKRLTALGPVAFFTHEYKEHQLVICSHWTDGSFKKEYIRAGRVISETNSWVTTDQPMWRVKSGSDTIRGRSFRQF